MIRPILTSSVLLALLGPAVTAAEEAPAAAQHQEQVTVAVGNLASFGIATEQVEAMVVAEPIVAPGWVTYNPQGEAQVGVQAAGKVIRITATVGSSVKAGDILAEVLSPGFVEAQNAWLIKRAALATADLAIEQAQAIVVRGQQTGDGISKAEMQRREFDLKVAQQARITATAELAAALNTLRLMGGESFDLDQLAKTGVAVQTLVLKAPVAGQVIDMPAVVGQNVSPEAGPVATIADASRLWVVAQIPEAVVTQVQVGCPVELTGFSGARLAGGTVSHLTPEIDPHTRTGRVRITVTSSDQLRPGMYVQAAIVPRQAGASAPVLAVPESALMNWEKRTVVFVEERQGENAVYRPRPVTVGAVQGGHAPVLSGVAAGETIVVQGAFLLKADLGKNSVGEEE
ncbi:MAG: efflux RND transporter periplasmic adaptor subunit [Planctomycetes bacterium]|nr:efflux RND transporter periplasmic adaptor subunit [Planctomycetota bacterium]